jgi:divalent metal cation (Fe/Co/Zn/Cd) transporter
VTEIGASKPLARSGDTTCADDCCTTPKRAPEVRNAEWHRAAGQARLLAWVSLVWMAAEGAIGLCQGFAVGSIALIGWALGSTVEGLASVIVVWRFTGQRTLSETAERRAQKAVAVSFWLLAPYVAIESVRDLLSGHRAEVTVLGMVLAASSLLVMPPLGYAKQRLGARLDSGATAGEGIQNYLCAAQAGAVLLSLAATAFWAGGWWLDPVIGLLIAGWSVWEGVQAWRGDDCC